MNTLIQRNNRNFETINSSEEITEIIKKMDKHNRLNLKGASDGSSVQIIDFPGFKKIQIFTEGYNTPRSNAITLCSLLDRYIEIELPIEVDKGDGNYLCRISKGRKAKEGRSHPRFTLKESEVIASNFRVSRCNMDINSTTIPTRIKVIIEQFQNEYSDIFEIFKIELFSKDDPLHESIKKTKQTLFVPDISNPEFYEIKKEGFLNLKKEMDEALHPFIALNIEQGHKSIIHTPLIYKSKSGKLVPLACMYIASKSRLLNNKDLHRVNLMKSKLIQRIIDANTHTFKINQEIINISRGGVKLSATDSELSDCLLESRGFIFDIVIKMQAPITLYGEVMYADDDGSGNPSFGIKFAGSRARKDDNIRFNALIDPMEKRYKTDLIKKMKSKMNYNLAS